MARRKLAAGNWKMNGTRADLNEVRALLSVNIDGGCDILLCPPATLLNAMADMAAGSGLVVGGQDCHAAANGAHTGDISAQMLADAGAGAVILGHSERRSDHGETDISVRAKAQAAHSAGLIAVICLGETETQRDSGTTLEIIGVQLTTSVPDDAMGSNTVIAYEPVWAIGTGRTPTIAQIAEVHSFLRVRLTARFGAAAQKFRLLYGGSVKPSNAAGIFSVTDVDGALVGGASLRAVDFRAIISALNG